MSTINFTVKVVSAQFTIDDGVAPKLTFRDGDTYVFDQADSSNSGHILQFSITSNNSGASEYTTGVTKTGTPGSAGAKTTIITSGSTTDTLYYYSSGGGTYGEEFSNSGFNTTAGGLLLPILGGAGEKWGSVLNHTISYIGAYIGGTYLKAPVYADDAARDTAIPSPANGMIIYNTAEGALQQYNGSWSTISSVPNIDSLSGFLNDDTDSTLTIFGSGFTSSSVVKMFNAASGGSQIGSNATTTFNSAAKLTAVFGAGSIQAAGTTAYIEVDNAGVTNRFVSALTVNADPTVTNVGATGTSAINHPTASSHLGTYSGAITEADTNTTLLLNFDRGGGTDIEDSSNLSSGGSGHKVIASNNAIIKASPFGDGKSAMFFDGTDDYLTIADSADWDFGTGAFTIEFWVLPTVLPSNGGVICSQYNESQVKLSYSAVGALAFWDGSAWITAATGTVTLNAWQHIAIVRTSTSASGIKFYRNGVSVHTGTSAGDITGDGSAWDIGRQDEGGNEQYFSGYLDDLRIVKGTAVYTSNFTVPTTRLTEITNTKLLIHSNRTDEGNTAFADSATTGTTHTVTASGGTIHSKLHGGIASALLFTASGKTFGSAGAYFDGATDYITISSSPILGTADFTIDFWLNVAATQNAGETTYYIWEGRTDNDADNTISITMNASDQLQINNFRSDKTTEMIPYHVDTAVTAGTWAHISVVRESANVIKLYIGGVLKGTSPDVDQGTFDNDGASKLGVIWGADSYEFTGYIDVFRMSNTARWTAPFTPPTKGYVGVAGSATLPTITFTGAATQLAADEDIEFTSVVNPTLPATTQHLTDSGVGLTLTNLTGGDKNKATLTGDLALAEGARNGMAVKAQVRKTLGSASYNNSTAVTFPSFTISCGTTNTDATVTHSSATTPRAGMGITGTGVPADTTILSVTSATAFELSANATVTGTATLTFTTLTTGLAPGMPLTGSGISVAGPLTCGLTNTDATVTAVSTTGLVVGMQVNAFTGVPVGATILSIITNTSFELSANATATDADAKLTFNTIIASVDSTTAITLSNVSTGGAKTGQDLIFEDLTRVAHVNGPDVLDGTQAMMTIAAGAVSGHTLYNARRFMGTGVTGKDITGFGFQPDMVWIKGRDNTDTWVVGATPLLIHSRLNISNTGAESTLTTGLQAFKQDGIQVGTSTPYNEVDKKFIVHGFKGAEGFTQEVDDGSIFNTTHFNHMRRSINVAGGFSVLHWKNDGGTHHTRAIPHGLGAIPHFVMMRPFVSAGWYISHIGMGDPYMADYSTGFGTGAKDTNATDTITNATTTYFYTSNNAGWYMNQADSRHFVAFFTSTTGVSKFGSYSGASGAKTVHLALDGDSSSGADTFTPRMLIIKRHNGTGGWLLYDTFRGFGTSGGSDGKRLLMNSSVVETTDSDGIAVAAGSFSMNTSAADINVSGGEYLYCAFA